MKAIADTHLHLYPEYDINRALNNFADHLPDAQTRGIACLAERHDCGFFQAILTDKLPLADFTRQTASEECISLQHTPSGKILDVLPGSQVITAENIEILALACPQRVTDGQAADAVVSQINQLGGVAVLPWSPGKWFFARGKVVKSLVDQFTPQELVIGDTTLRPYGYLMPLLIRRAIRQGFTLTAGSDPLPMTGEERWFGVFSSTLDGEADTAPALIRGLLNRTTRCLSNHGQRSTPWGLLARLSGNAKSKKLAYK